jgi:ABC-type lipoprotein release transport system permease subunit
VRCRQSSAPVVVAVAAIALIVACVLFAASAASGLELPGVLLSRQLMARHNLRFGDTVRLAAQASGEGARLFRIDGVYEPVADPLRFAQPAFEARLHLPDLLSLTDRASHASVPQTLSSINVKLADPSQAEAFARDVAARLPGTVARSTRVPDERTATFVVIERFLLAVATVTMLGSALFLLALMVLLVEERRESVGTLRLLGFTRGRILRQVFAEGALIALAGTIGGLLFAFAAQDAFNRLFQWRYDTALVFLRITPGIVGQSILVAVPLGIAASVVASWTLLRRTPLGLLRR